MKTIIEFIIFFFPILFIGSWVILWGYCTIKQAKTISKLQIMKKKFKL